MLVVLSILVVILAIIVVLFILSATKISSLSEDYDEKCYDEYIKQKEEDEDGKVS